MDIKQEITSRFDKSKFELSNCGTAADGDWHGVDENIRDFIMDLNKREHISTLYSCEGHKEKDDAYLFFNVDEIGWDIFWLRVMPELSNRFCFVHPEVSHGLYAMKWGVYTKSNEYNAGITVRTDLDNFIVEETGRIIIGWEQKKETFWNIVKEVFLKYYTSDIVVCKNCSSENVSTEEDFRRVSGPRVPGKLMSYAYYFYRHNCKDCLNTWESEKKY